VARGPRAGCPPPLGPIHLVRTLFSEGGRERGREGGRFACRIPTPSCRHHHNRSLSFYHSYTHTHCREELDLATDTDDMDQRLKYAGIFHRRKRTPGRFMMRYVTEGGRERGREGGGVTLLSDRPLAHQTHFQHTHTHPPPPPGCVSPMES